MSVNIVDLLPEVLEEIFRHLPKANDRRRVAQVCRTFYRIVRGQSKKFSTLYLTDNAPNKSPVQVFKNSTTFPFSKLHDGFGAKDMILDQDFWLEHGQCITELTIDYRFSFQWLTFFPYLKKLKLDRSSKLLLIEENAPKIHLPLEELCIGYQFSMNEICYILQCCPSVKSVELSIHRDHFKTCADLLPWIESIETVKMDFGGVELKEIAQLPSKVVLKFLIIWPNTSVESIASFFDSPRYIEALFFDFDLSDNQSTKNKIFQLLKAESINKLVLSSVPKFPGSLDLLSQVPGLQEISTYLSEKIFLPHYWSNPNTANKIYEIKFIYDLYPEVLTGLSSLSSLTIGSSDGNLEVLRNHPKLKKLEILSFDGGNAELEPISSLHDLEILELKKAPNVTSAAFKTTIKFPKLKKLLFCSEVMESDDAMLLSENCPNLEELELGYVQDYFDFLVGTISIDDLKGPLNDSGFEHLIRALPYLKEIKISGSHHSVSQEKVQQMKMEFPYMKTNI